MPTTAKGFRYPAGTDLLSAGDDAIHNLASDVDGFAGWVPVGGASGAVLAKTGSADYAAGWSTPHYVPAGGSAGQVLAKASAADYALAWTTPAGGGGGAAPLAATVAALTVAYGGAPPDGAMGVLRPAGTSDRLLMVYDAALAKWVSEQRLVTTYGGNQSNAGFGFVSSAYADTVEHSAAQGGGSIAATTFAWRPFDGAGLVPHLRFTGRLGGDAGSTTAYAQCAYFGADAGANLGASIPVPASEKSVSGFAASTQVLVDSGWWPIPAGWTVRDFLIAEVQLKLSNGTNRVIVRDMGVFARWVG